MNEKHTQGRLPPPFILDAHDQLRPLSGTAWFFFVVQDGEAMVEVRAWISQGGSVFASSVTEQRHPASEMPTAPEGFRRLFDEVVIKLAGRPILSWASVEFDGRLNGTSGVVRVRATVPRGGCAVRKSFDN